jgi:RNA polymerase sigma-70 factor (ECF subfamily)
MQPYGMSTMSASIDDTAEAAPTSMDRAEKDRTADRVVPQALAGDEAAFRWIVESFSSDMRQVCFVVTGDLELAEEAVAASWPIAWRKLSSLRKPSSLRPWLVSIAAREARRFGKAKSSRVVREISMSGTAYGAERGSPVRSDIGPHDRVESIDLANVLVRLDPDDRALLALRYVAGLNSTELARFTGLTPAGTRARLQRLLDRLRRELRDD